MSSVADTLSRLMSSNEPGQVDPTTLLEVLLAAAATKAPKEPIAEPPPQVLVRWNSHEIAFSRASLQNSDMVLIYRAFTSAFDLSNKGWNATMLKVWNDSVREYVSYVPMKIYVTFLQGSGAEAKKEHEASDWQESWRGIVPNIDEIHIVTLPEYRARRKREEEVFQEELVKRVGDSTKGTKDVSA